MTYEALETGMQGSPVELFHFQRGTSCWAYTSADSTQDFSGLTYEPVAIARGSYERNDEAASSTLVIRLDRTLKVVSQFLDGSTPEPVNLTVYRKHRDDSEHIVMFRGIVANAEMQGEEVSLRCVSPLSADEKSLPRQLIMRTCPHVLYGPMCQLDPDSHKVTGFEIDHITGVRYDVEGMGTYADDYFTAGLIYNETRGGWAFIQRHDYYITGDNRFYLLQPVPGWAVGDDVTIYQGCDRKHTTCRDKFSNMANFGGFPLHPERNPLLDLDVEED